MRIEDPLLEPYFITNDAYSFQVMKKGLNDKMAYKETGFGFFGSLGDAVRKIAKLQLFKDEFKDVENLRQFAARFDVLTMKVDQICDKLRITVNQVKKVSNDISREG